MILKLLRGALMSIGALYLIVTFTPLDNCWIAALSGPMCDPHGDVLVLLSAEALGDAIGYDSYWRAVYGVRAWRSDGFHEVFICGGPGANGMPASVPMREFMIGEGVPAAAIQIDAASHSTRENALNAAAALRNVAGKKVLLTSDFHTFRASRAFRKAGLKVESCSFPDFYKQASPRLNRWSVFMGLCQETTKIAYYYARGWI